MTAIKPALTHIPTHKPNVDNQQPDKTSQKTKKSFWFSGFMVKLAEKVAHRLTQSNTPKTTPESKLEHRAVRKDPQLGTTLVKKLVMHVAKHQKHGSLDTLRNAILASRIDQSIQNHVDRIVQSIKQESNVSDEQVADYKQSLFSQFKQTKKDINQSLAQAFKGEKINLDAASLIDLETQTSLNLKKHTPEQQDAIVNQYLTTKDHDSITLQTTQRRDQFEQDLKNGNMPATDIEQALEKYDQGANNTKRSAEQKALTRQLATSVYEAARVKSGTSRAHKDSLADIGQFCEDSLNATAANALNSIKDKIASKSVAPAVPQAQKETQPPPEYITITRPASVTWEENPRPAMSTFGKAPAEDARNSTQDETAADAAAQKTQHQPETQPENTERSASTNRDRLKTPTFSTFGK